MMQIHPVRHKNVFTLDSTPKAGNRCDVFGEFSKYAGQVANNIQVNVGARWNC